eukprot:2356522-Amphidinium_carterae.1
MALCRLVLLGKCATNPYQCGLTHIMCLVTCNYQSCDGCREFIIATVYDLSCIAPQSQLRARGNRARCSFGQIDDCGECFVSSYSLDSEGDRGTQMMAQRSCAFCDAIDVGCGEQFRTNYSRQPL